MLAEPSPRCIPTHRLGRINNSRIFKPALRCNSVICCSRRTVAFHVCVSANVSDACSCLRAPRGVSDGWLSGLHLKLSAGKENSWRIRFMYENEEGEEEERMYIFLWATFEVSTSFTFQPTSELHLDKSAECINCFYPDRRTCAREWQSRKKNGLCLLAWVWSAWQLARRREQRGRDLIWKSSQCGQTGQKHSLNLSITLKNAKMTAHWLILEALTRFRTDSCICCFSRAWCDLFF